MSAGFENMKDTSVWFGFVYCRESVLQRLDEKFIG